MMTLKGTILAAALLATVGSAAAAVNPRTGTPVETPDQIYARCGILLSNPNAIAAAAGTACSAVSVHYQMSPSEGDGN